MSGQDNLESLVDELVFQEEQVPGHLFSGSNHTLIQALDFFEDYGDCVLAPPDNSSLQNGGHLGAPALVLDSQVKDGRGILKEQEKRPKGRQLQREFQIQQVLKSANMASAKLAKKRKRDKQALNRNTCYLCGKLFDKRSNLVQHIRSHTGEKPFQCPICAQRFTQKSNMKKHVEAHKVWPSQSCDIQEASVHQGLETSFLTTGDGQISEIEVLVRRVYKCSLCDQGEKKAFPTHSDLMSHLAKFHGDQKVFECPLVRFEGGCNKAGLTTTTKSKEYVAHLKDHHPDDKVYRCCKCSEGFPTLARLDLHLFSHEHQEHQHPETEESTLQHDVSALACSECKVPTVFSSHSSLKRHLIDVHGQISRASSDAQGNRDGRSRDPAISCSICSKVFKSETYLKGHLRSHSSNHPFHCSTCGAKFHRRDMLSRHRLTHDSARRYHCPFKEGSGCDRQFYRLDKLKEHIKVHGQRASIKCDVCGDEFQRAAQLRRHVQALHPKKMNYYKCASCEQTFPEEELRQKHFEKAHRGIMVAGALVKDDGQTLSIILTEH